MGLSASPVRAAAASLALLALLAACDKPKDRTRADQGGPLGATGAIANAPPASATAPSGAGAANTTTDALPDRPKWSADYIGKPLKDLFAEKPEACVGNTDVVAMRYNGPFSTGARIEGWGWDLSAKKPVARILIVSDDGKVVGAGETGLPRPDVNAGRKDITSPTTGWQAYTTQTSGGVYAFGLTGEKSACRLGHINL